MQNTRKLQSKIRGSFGQMPGFSLDLLDMGGGGICSPYMGVTGAGGQSVNWRGGGHRNYGGPNFDRLYHKLKVMLLLLLLPLCY